MASSCGGYVLWNDRGEGFEDVVLLLRCCVLVLLELFISPRFERWRSRTEFLLSKKSWAMVGSWWMDAVFHGSGRSWAFSWIDVNCGGRHMMNRCLRSVSEHGMAWERERLRSFRHLEKKSRNGSLGLSLSAIQSFT